MLNRNFKNKILISHGFTLIEVLIAILILSFISLYAYKMIDENTDTKDKVTTEDRDYMQTLTALNRIEQDFNEYYTPLFSSAKQDVKSSDPYQDTSQSFNQLFEGKTKSGMPIPAVMQEEKNSLVFLSKINRRKVAETKESNFVWIKYSLKTTEDEEERKHGGFSLIRQTISMNPFQTTLNWSDVREQVILNNIKSLEFQFYDERNKKYVGALADLNEYKNLLRSIKVVFTWINKDNNEFKFDKTFRVLHPYFNTKQDELKSNGGAWPDGNVPPGLPTPPADDGNTGGGSNDKHF